MNCIPNFQVTIDAQGTSKLRLAQLFDIQQSFQIRSLFIQVRQQVDRQETTAGALPRFEQQYRRLDETS